MLVKYVVDCLYNNDNDSGDDDDDKLLGLVALCANNAPHCFLREVDLEPLSHSFAVNSSNSYPNFFCWQ